MTQSNTEELNGAKTATTGEQFNSLDERIDCEIDRLNKKIEVSMLQQESAESHIIENSVEGMTTDMVIKGRTFNNLITNGQGTFAIDKSVDDNSRIHIFSTTYPLQTGKTYKGYLVMNNIENANRLSIYGYYDSTGGLTAYGNSTLNNNLGIIKFTWTPTNSNNDKFYLNKIGLYLEHSDFINGAKATFSDFMLFEEETDLTYIDEYFDGIKSFGQQEDKISILSSGKNLVDLKNILDDFSISYTSLDGGYKINGNGKLFRGLFYPKNPKKQYTLTLEAKTITMTNFRCEVVYTDGSLGSTEIIREQNKMINLIMTTRSDKEIAYFRMNWTNTGEVVLKNLQIEEGARTPYEPYKCDKKDILLQELGFDEGLMGLNNIVYDELNSIKNVAIKRVAKYIVTGNENFITDIRGDYMYCYFILEGSKSSSGVEAICNQFKYIDGLWNKDNPSVQGQEGFDLSGSNSLSFQLSINKLETHNTEGVKKYFKSLYDGGNPVEVYYWLAEPIETHLNENINTKTFGERTYVSFGNAISGTSSFKIPVDTIDTIVRLNRENRALEEENKTLRQDFESITLVLTDSDLELVKQNVDMDFRLMEVEFALDIPQAILSSDIKFKNKKGEVKSMARTPYEMMKIVILSGDYDREDYMYKVGKYYERGRMTKEEHDELMSLMTADEVISK
ncbi:MAG: hypothetical protein KHZ90_09850 [Veillonella parvula]|uniref:Uncharacterized protein n=2 Tax=Veillonella parvula TaxID=29466 RepID=A0A942WNN0_VEIPA|nr:hypothetical protein [Veillonella parvula]